MFRSCCATFCNLTTFVTLVVLLFARNMYDASVLTPTFSEQWVAEMGWWTKFLIGYKILGMRIEPLPLSVLNTVHSNLNVVNLYPEKDPDAVKKFLEMAGNKKHDNDIIILRNIWANATDNKMKLFNNVDTFRQYADLDKEYETMLFPLHGKGDLKQSTFGGLLDTIEKTDDKLQGLLFSYNFFETQDFIREEYRKLWASVSPDLEKRVLSGRRRSHVFLYYGTKWITPLHAAPASDYFLQIANSKQWRFVHKKYIPYIGIRNQPGSGVLGTPVYFTDNYPSPIPYTEITLQPGDFMYFSTWHFHEVTNLEDEKLGFAIGIRPFEGLLTEPFGPMNLFNILNIPSHILNIMQTNTFGANQLDATCGSRRGLDHGQVYNGTTLSRYDFKMKDGNCYLEERVPDYQTKEINGELGVHEWKPWKPFGNLLF